MQPPALSASELELFLAKEFPEFYNPANGLSIEEVRGTGARVRQTFNPQFIRPGGTISGPTMMALADFTMYVAVLGAIGPVPLAVTSNFAISFLRKPGHAALVADCRLLKVGKTLAFGEILIGCEGSDEPVAHATATYSIPAKR